MKKIYLLADFNKKDKSVISAKFIKNVKKFVSVDKTNEITISDFDENS